MVQKKNYSVCKNCFEEISNIKTNLILGDLCIAKKPDVSICIPTYNRPELLKECIKSVLSQMDSTLVTELIIVDNNDTKNNINKEVLEEFSNCNILYYKNEENVGIFGNWNRCIELASGTWVALLHDDDLLMDDCFRKWSKIISNIENRKDNVAYIKATTHLFYDNIENIKEPSVKSKIRSLYKSKCYKLNRFDFSVTGTPGKYGAPTAGTLINRDAILKIGGYNNEFFPTDDAYVPVRFMDNGYKVLCTASELGYYRYSVNESYKKEIQDGWVDEFLSFSSYIKDYGLFYKLYINFLKNEQFYVFVNEYLLQFVPNEDKSVVLKEINEINMLKYSKVKMCIYKCTRFISYRSVYIRAIY